MPVRTHVEVLHDGQKSLVLLSNQVLRRDHDVIKGDEGCAGHSNTTAYTASIHNKNEATGPVAHPQSTKPQGVFTAATPGSCWWSIARQPVCCMHACMCWWWCKCAPQYCAREASQILGGSSIVKEGKGKVIERLVRATVSPYAVQVASFDVEAGGPTRNCTITVVVLSSWLVRVCGLYGAGV